MKTLESVVKIIIDSINMPNFSAYDITGLVRHHVESRKSTEKFDIRLSPPNSPHWYDVRHNEVKQIVEDMLNDGDLSRVNNGLYYLYNKNQVAPNVAPIVQSKVKSIPVTNSTRTPPTSTLTDYVFGYLMNQPLKSATAKRIQSALKRKGNFKCSEIISINHPRIGIDFKNLPSNAILAIV